MIYDGLDSDGTGFANALFVDGVITRISPLSVSEIIEQSPDNNPRFALTRLKEEITKRLDQGEESATRRP